MNGHECTHADEHPRAYMVLGEGSTRFGTRFISKESNLIFEAIATHVVGSGEGLRLTFGC